MSLTRRALLVVLSILLSGLLSIATAQNPYTVETRPPRGFMPAADQLASPADSIDPVNGKLHLQIPLASLPRGRAGSGFDLDLVYDSHLYDILPNPFTYHPTPTSPPETAMAYDLDFLNLNGGWAYNFKNYKLEAETRRGVDLSDQCAASEPQRVYRYRVRLADGSLHVLHLRRPTETFPWDQGYEGDGFFAIKANGTASPCAVKWGWPAQTNGWLTYYTSDGSYLKLEIYANGTDWQKRQWFLYFPDGRRVVGRGFQAEQLYDANNNKNQIINVLDANNRPLYSAIRDESGREVRVNYNVTNVDESNPNVVRKQDRITTTGANGSQISWTIDWEAVLIGANGRKYRRADVGTEVDQFADLAFRHWIVKYVQMPLSAAVPLGSVPPPWNSYEFGYSDNNPAELGYGELNLMRVPAGAVYNYRYRLENSPCDPTPYTGNCSETESIAHYNSVKDKTIAHDGISDLHWTYHIDRTQNKSTVTNPDGGEVVHWYSPGGVLRDIGDVVYRIDEPNGAVRKRLWAQNKVWYLLPGLIKNPNNPYIQRETVTVGDGFGNPTKTAVSNYFYDKNGNLLQRNEYDWVDYIPGSPPYTYNPSSVETGGASKRITRLTYFVQARSAADDSQNDANAYWQPHVSPLKTMGARRLDAVRRRDISSDGVNVYSAAEFDYDEPFTPYNDALDRGNVTAERRWDAPQPGTPPPQLTAGISQIWTRSYDAYGNLTDIYEPADNGEPGRRTHIAYEPGGNLPEYVYYGYGATAQRSWQYSWNSAAGVLNWKRDVDNNLTTFYGYDNVGRQTTVNESNLRMTRIEPRDPERKVIVKRDLAAFGDGNLQTITDYDQLGRVTLVRTRDTMPLSEMGSEGIQVKTRYLAFPGQPPCVIRSSPYRNSGDPALEWQRTEYDRLGRVSAVAMFKTSEPSDCGTTQNRTGVTQTQFDINFETGRPRVRMMDPAGKIRDEENDALGRLVRVHEDPLGLGYSTFYSYDPLDDLVQVTQGVQTRAFSYSTLGRLRSATHPENGTTTYQYYASGDLRLRADGRGVQTAFTYDTLHRMLTRTYSNDPEQTPAVTYEYYPAGSPAPKAGQLKSVTSRAGATVVASTVHDNYDGLGHVTTNTNTIYGYPTSLQFTYSWWLNDAPRTIQYPSGRVLNYNVDPAGRPTKVYTATKTYADLSAAIDPYTPDGRIAKMKLGNNLWETRDYPAPGTPTKLKLGTAENQNDRLELEYNYSPIQNNGNLLSQVIRRRAGATTWVWSQSFADGDSYDGLNRLKKASETTTAGANNWTQSYGYDVYGNRWVASTMGSGLTSVDIHEPTVSTNFDTATNRINLQGSQFDAAGNQIVYTPYTLYYDGENRNTWVTSANNGNVTFTYDGDGRRVKKISTSGNGATTTTYYAYNALGQLAAEYSNQTASTGTSYLFADLLGSTRAVTDSAGSVVECYDYLPFGRYLGAGDNHRTAAGCYPNLGQPITGRAPQKFTGKERDAETGLDYFGARYMSAAQGRFLSPDIEGPERTNPQTLNKYRYALNNPLRYIDPNGRYEVDVHRHLTYALSVAAGISTDVARRIGASDQGVDDGERNPSGVVPLPFGDQVTVREQWHFSNPARREELFTRFETTGSPRALGIFLHAQQDSYSHAGFGPVFGHSLYGTSVDKTYNNPEKADRMANNTFSILVSAASKLMGGNPLRSLSAAEIQPFLRDFNRAEKDENKRRILDQLIDRAKRKQRKNEDEEP